MTTALSAGVRHFKAVPKAYIAADRRVPHYMAMKTCMGMQTLYSTRICVADSFGVRKVLQRECVQSRQNNNSTTHLAPTRNSGQSNQIPKPNLFPPPTQVSRNAPSQNVLSLPPPYAYIQAAPLQENEPKSKYIAHLVS